MERRAGSEGSSWSPPGAADQSEAPADVRRGVEPIPLAAQRCPFDKEVEELVAVRVVSDQGTETRVLLLGEDVELDS